MPTTKPSKASIKSQATKLVRELPETASWDDLMYQIYVRQKIETGLTDVQAGRTHRHAAIKKEFGIIA
jgi:hypothetical protein